MGWTERTELLLGAGAVERLAASSVLVAGCGGVGAWAAEMIVRAGVGKLTIIDSDTVTESNINRQLPALHSTIGQSKCSVLAARFRDINPDIRIHVIESYICQDNIPSLLDGEDFDVVLDAIDTLSPKVAFLQYCLSRGWKTVSSMGAGAKTDATAVRIADISETYQCPLAHQLRKRLHRLGISEGITAVFSVEKPSRAAMAPEESRNKKTAVGTVSYLPAAFGCACAQAVTGAIA